jgi:MFS family permease
VSNLAVVKNYPAAPAAATGISQTGVYAGAVLGPSIFGLLAERVGYRGAWLGAAACSALAGALVIASRYVLLRALATANARNV